MKDNVEFNFSDGGRQVFKRKDIIDLNTEGLTVRVYDRRIPRLGLEFVCNRITEIDVKGDVTPYPPIEQVRSNKSVQKARYNEIVTKLIDDVFLSCAEGVYTPGGGNGTLPTDGELREVLSTTILGTEWKQAYYDYIVNVEYTGITAAITGGTVYEAEINGGNVYRFVSTTLNGNGYPDQDSFYRSFNGITLTDLITTRG